VSPVADTEPLRRERYRDSCDGMELVSMERIISRGRGGQALVDHRTTTPKPHQSGKALCMQ